MNQLDMEMNSISTDRQFNVMEAKEISLPDYDDQPYGDDNVLVRASKRRSFLNSVAKL